MPPRKPITVIREYRPNRQRVLDAILLVLTARPSEGRQAYDIELSHVVETAPAAVPEEDPIDAQKQQSL